MNSDAIERLNSALAGRYLVERELGEGGMATVYLADDLRHSRRVALKVLKPELAAAVGAERFLAEIRTTANLQHPHILPLFDSGEADGFLFYVMPYVDGETLRDRLNRSGPLSVDEVLRIMRDVSGALDHAHSRGVIHRDIKPANILLGEGGAFVADFGIALAVSNLDRAQLTATGLSLGTPVYMSPEQIGGEPAIDGRSDVYALGCLVYESLAGEPPFSASSFQGLIGKVLTTPAPSVRVARPDVAKAVSDAIARALAKRPDERFETAGAFYEACAPALTPAPKRRAPRVALAVGTVLVLVAGVAGWRALQASGARNLIPEIERLAAAGRYVEAYGLGERAERWLGDDPTVGELMAEVSDLVTVTSEPEGAQVFVQRFHADPSQIADSQLIGVTPIVGYRLPRADHRTVVRMEGRIPVERIASSEFARETEVASSARELILAVSLLRTEEAPADMVAVPGGDYQLASPDSPVGPSVLLDPFFVDRYEVTNEAFAAFVAEGGYTRTEWWQGVPADVRADLVDATGLAGPRGWARQTFADGAGRAAVGGVSWYEALAFCRSQNKRLPTLYEWEKAARDGRISQTGVLMPWGRQGSSDSGVRRANFNGAGVGDVDAFPFGISPYGAYGMAGNMREWAANPMGEGYAIAGGSWAGPAYLYTEYSAEPPDFSSNALGFRCARSEGAGDQGGHLIDRDITTPTYSPVDESGFRALLGHYAYDRRPANARVTSTEDFPAWTRERIWIDGPGSDSVLLYFYAPKRAAPPYQTIVYVPGSSTFFTETLPDEMEWSIGPTIQAGRAVVTVVMKGMLERPFEPGYAIPPPPSVGFRDLMVLHATELRLGIDYAVSREDVDPEALAYVAVSFGAGSRLAFSAVDDRYKAVIYIGGGIDERVKPTLPEADNVNFAPYVRVPTLLINGRSDEEHPWLSRGLPLWNLLREPKELVLIEGGGHVVPLQDRIPAINDFLDRTLGPVRSR